MKKYVIKSLLLLMMLFMIVSCRNPIENNLTVNKFTVTFDSMGGSLVTSAEAFENSLATTPTAPTKADYKLGGWYTDNTTFTNKWDFATNKVTGNITLYAKWIPDAVSCTVTYNSDGGTVVSSATEEVGKIITAPTPPTKVDYTFGGWYKENTLTTPWNFATDIVAGNMTLYAKWKASEILVEAGTAGTSGITTTKSFYIHQFEVTQSQFLDLMLYNPSAFSGDNRPVENVTWYDAITYANKLSEKEGFDKFYNISNIIKTGVNITSATVTENSGAKGYRLPTENEWRYSAYGGKSSQNYDYAGSDISNDVAWTYENNTTNGESSGTKEIGRKAANELGIHDMSGNVHEWVQSVSLSEYFQGFRGGSWGNPPQVIQDNTNTTANPSAITIDIGFRLVRDY